RGAAVITATATPTSASFHDPGSDTGAFRPAVCLPAPEALVEQVRASLIGIAPVRFRYGTGAITLTVKRFGERPAVALRNAKAQASLTVCPAERLRHPER